MESILICRTCPRDLPGSGEFGRLLHATLQAAALTCDIMLVHCLGSCRLPCAVALDSDAGPRIRFSLLGSADAAHLVDSANEYRVLIAEGKATDQLPVSLRHRISAVSPKPSTAPLTPPARGTAF